MKKIICIMAIASITLPSCKKDRICECKTSTVVVNSNNTNSSTEVHDITYMHVTKRTAKLACIHSKTVNINTNTTVTTDNDCKLK